MFKTLGEALFGQAFRKTVWVSFDNINKHEFGAFDPSAPLLAFAQRYGAPAKRKGDLVGERYARFIVEDVIRHPSNPLGIENNQSYTLRDGEEYDVKLATTGADISAYDSFFRPTHKRLFPETAPAPPPAPAPKPQPLPPQPTPRPTPQPPGRSTEAQRVEELRTVLRAALSGFTAPVLLRPGIDKFLVSEFTSLALLRAVQLYRKAFS